MCDVIMMSLDLYCNVWQRLIIISIHENMGWSPSLLPKLVHIPSFTTIGTTVIELHEFKKKNVDKKLHLAIIFTFD